MEEFKRVLVPMRPEEARGLLRVEAQRLGVKLEACWEEEVVVVANCVPRELLHFIDFVHEFQASQPALAISHASSASTLTAATAETPSELLGVVQRFVEWRSRQIEQQAMAYFSTLAIDRQLRTGHLHSLTAMLARSSMAGNPSDLFDLGFCYLYFVGWFGNVVRPLCFAVSTALLRFYHAQASAHSPLLKMLESTHMRNLRGDDFEDLMWHYLTRCCGAKGGVQICSYYLDGTKAPPLRFKWHDFYSLDTYEQTPPAVLRNRAILFRCHPRFSRWDFMAPNMLLQVSRSPFSTRNTGGADIRLSFGKGAKELCDILDALHGGSHSYSAQAGPSAVDGPAVFSTSNSFRRSGHAEPVALTLVYVTLEKPNYPELLTQFPDLRVVAAEEVWR